MGSKGCATNSPLRTWIYRPRRRGLDLLVEHTSDFASQPQVPVGRKLDAVSVQCEPVALFRRIATPRRRFQDCRALVHFVEHGNLQYSCAGYFGVVCLSPQELAA